MVVAGCATDPLKKRGPGPLSELDETTGTEAPSLPKAGLLVAPNRRFPDIPLPQNVKEDIERSYVYESSSLKLGRMVYTSRDSLSELAQFYIRECPPNDWNLESVLQAEGYEMVFKKPGKRLTVLIRNLGIAQGRLLILNLTPQDVPNAAQ